MFATDSAATDQQLIFTADEAQPCDEPVTSVWFHTSTVTLGP